MAKKPKVLKKEIHITKIHNLDTGQITTNINVNNVDPDEFVGILQRVINDTINKRVEVKGRPDRRPNYMG